MKNKHQKSLMAYQLQWEAAKAAFTTWFVKHVEPYTDHSHNLTTNSAIWWTLE